MNYEPSLQRLRDYFNTGATQSYSFRKEQLHKLKSALVAYEEELYAALESDLGKNKEEAWITETGFVISEINAAVKRLHHWMNPEKVGTTLLNFPSSSYIMHEPLGVVLIIGPWNYPVQLLLTPLIGAIAAGNCIVLKPSEVPSATSALMKKLVASVFPPEYILCVEGEGASVVPNLMNATRFDHVFYTGSTAVGRLIYKMAADKLVPVTLELGGKSPCVIDEDANLEVAARRIAVTKFSNAGQMCVAPDYLLVHHKVTDRFIDAFKKVLLAFYTENAERNHAFGRIINQTQFDRIVGYLNKGTVVYGGRHEREKLFIEPTIITGASLETPIMQEEIFGPVVPVLPFNNKSEALQVIARNADPLAFYIFTSSNKNAEWWVKNVAAGGVCVNNCSWHLTNHHLPFGGRGNSGIGRYHGKFSFETFSHKKAVMKTPTWFDPRIKYPPFEGKLSLFKKIVR